MMILFDRVWDILVLNRRAYFVLNALYYGLIVVLMIYTSFNHALHESVLERYGVSFITGPLALDGKAPVMDMETLTSAFLTLLLNLLGVTYAGISLPSFIIPFAGIFSGLYRAILLGISFSPVDPFMARIFFPHLPTLLLEGQAIILAMLGAYIQGRAMIWPATVNHTSRWKAYIEGVRQSGTMYMLIMPILLISAIYGVIEGVLLATP